MEPFTDAALIHLAWAETPAPAPTGWSDKAQSCVPATAWTTQPAGSPPGAWPPPVKTHAERPQPVDTGLGSGGDTTLSDRPTVSSSPGDTAQLKTKKKSGAEEAKYIPLNDRKVVQLMLGRMRAGGEGGDRG